MMSPMEAIEMSFDRAADNAEALAMTKFAFNDDMREKLYALAEQIRFVDALVRHSAEYRQES